MVVDSSVWLEILARGPLAARCEKYLNDFLEKDDLVISAVTLFEVYKNLKKKFGDEEAVDLLGGLSQCLVVNVNRELALQASDLSLEHGLAMADAMVLACAQRRGAKLLTLDNDFAKIDDAIVLRR